MSNEEVKAVQETVQKAGDFDIRYASITSLSFKNWLSFAYSWGINHIWVVELKGLGLWSLNFLVRV